MHTFCAEFVDLAYCSAAFFGVVVNDIAHLCEGQNGDTDPKLVHLFDGLLRRPWTAATAARSAGEGSRSAATTSPEREPGGLMVVVNIDVSAL